MESVERHDRLYRERIKHFELFRIKTFGHIFLMGAVRLSEKVLESIRIYHNFSSNCRGRGGIMLQLISAKRNGHHVRVHMSATTKSRNDVRRTYSPLRIRPGID